MFCRFLPLILPLGMVTILPSCDSESEFSETRELTTLDEKPVSLTVTSKDRFEMPDDPEDPLSPNAPADDSIAKFTFTAPAEWEELAPTMFRSVNLKLPEGGELYVSQVGGQVLSNLNRWYGQFGAQPITADQLADLEPVTLLGNAGFLIEAQGAYNPGMGRPAMENQKLLGAIASNDGALLTVKLIASPEEADKYQDAFKTFCTSLAIK